MAYPLLGAAPFKTNDAFSSITSQKEHIFHAFFPKLSCPKQHTQTIHISWAIRAWGNRCWFISPSQLIGWQWYMVFRLPKPIRSPACTCFYNIIVKQPKIIPWRYVIEIYLFCKLQVYYHCMILHSAVFHIIVYGGVSIILCHMGTIQFQQRILVK